MKRVSFIKHLVSVFLAAGVVFWGGCFNKQGGSSGGGKPSDLAGHWIHVSGTTRGMPEDMELYKDGTGISGETSITWKVENNRLVLLSAMKGSSYDYKVSGYELTLIDKDGERAVLVKKEKLEEYRTKKAEDRAKRLANSIKQLEQQFVQVKGGTFTMGCTNEQGNDCNDDEKTAHSVTVGDFYIGKYEVTQELWEAVMDENPSYFTEGENLPVENVSWNDAQEFIRKLNSITGKNYRLPTEAEWEFAARGGNKSKGYKYSGGNNMGNVGWYIANSGDKALKDGLLQEYFEKEDYDGLNKLLSSNKNRTHPVGQKAPNELGIYDMSGNVLEWCSDWYGDYSSSPVSDPVGPTYGSYRVNRGGGWNSYA